MLKLGLKKYILLFAAVVSTGLVANAQDKGNQRPVVIVDKVNKDLPVAARTNLFCAGYIQSGSVNTDYRLVGADEERDRFIYAQGNFVYLNRGASNGVKVGDKFAVVRPAGKFSSKHSKKSGLGIYVHELGMVEVVRTKDEVSVARVKVSCDNFLLGDLLMPVPDRTSPMFQKRPALDLFGEPSGKAEGRIVLAKEAREMIGRDMVVYIDLGSEDGVKAGDYLTIFRPLGKGGVLNETTAETLSARQAGYESKVYKGGKYSNQAARKSGDQAEGMVVTTDKAKDGRPALRKVVGEMVIINVREKTATAVVTRTAQEIHTGDRVEVQ